MACIFYYFCRCSYKYLQGEAGAAELIEALKLGTVDGMTCRGKIAPYLKETFVLFWLIIAL